jgi:hypothetical protein
MAVDATQAGRFTEWSEDASPERLTIAGSVPYSPRAWPTTKSNAQSRAPKMANVGSAHA